MVKAALEFALNIEFSTRFVVEGQSINFCLNFSQTSSTLTLTLTLTLLGPMLLGTFSGQTRGL